VDRGYVKAPVSYDGELIPAFGGGVCQTSTTLYNVALRAGLPILERHHHVFAPHYCAPGTDAAVAYPTIDLRFRNPYSYPLRLRASADGDRLQIELWGARKPDMEAQIEPRVLGESAPRRRTRVVNASGTAYGGGRNPGMTGYRVVTYRIFTRDGREIRRERLSDDSYPVMDRVVTVAADEQPALD
jgi:vancomycin resistance protein YoaR